MSFYSDASLVMIPSGYKTSKVYSAVPTSGDGDLVFSRSNDTATRVGPDGLIEKVRTNVLLHSQTLDNAVWSTASATISANAAPAPDGTTTAEKLIPAAAADPAAPDASQLQQIIAVASNTYTFSIYAKAAGQNSVRIRENNSWGNFLNLNLTTGATNIIGGNFGQFNNVQVQTLANGWYRLSFTTEAGVTNFSKYSIRGGETGDGTSGVFLWGAQLEVSDFGATPYIATTTAAVSVGPVANVPRLDYLNSSCPRLLLEPQRTNNVTYSEQLDNAAWTLVNAGSASAPVVTANYGISPDGTQNAERVQFSRTGTTSSDYSLLDRATISTAAGVVSFYGKSLSGTQSILLYYGSVGQVFTLTTEWQRFTLYSASTSTDLTIGTRGGSGSYFNGGSLTIDCLLWGFQKEAGAYATSYVNTLNSAVTRGADACSKTGISSLIGQTEGTIFLDVNLDSRVSFTYFALAPSLGSSANYIGIAFTATAIDYEVIAGGVAQATLGSVNSTTGRFKIAATYKANDFSLYINGIQIGTDTSGTVPTCSEIGLYQFSQAQSLKYNQALLFPTRLSNDSLAELTSL